MPPRMCTCAGGVDQDGQPRGDPNPSALAQLVQADANLIIPEEVLHSNFDLDQVLSNGLDIIVLAAERPGAGPHGAAGAPARLDLHAQVDCYEQSDGSVHGKIHYILENVGDLCKVYHGYQVRGLHAWVRTPGS
jgi:hypothetical protein